jgi:phosphoglucosamine mutase
MAAGLEPDGRNINDRVGSEYPAGLQSLVRAWRCDGGLAHDGDGDRVVMADEDGNLLTGEEILAILAHAWHESGRLNPPFVVTTVLSNLGLDESIGKLGGKVIRTPVGDRQVAQEMAERGAILGGEGSGHIIVGDRFPTGDGLLAALEILTARRQLNRPLHTLRKVVRLYPQGNRNLPVEEKVPLDACPALMDAFAAIECQLLRDGRLLVRYSGTEPKLRLLAEAPMSEKVTEALTAAEAAARKHLPVLSIHV